MVILAWHSRHQVYTLAIQSSVTVDQDIKRLRAPPLSLQYLIKLLYILTTRTAIHYLSHTRPRRKTYHRERTQQPISKESTSNPSTSRHLNTTTHRANDTNPSPEVTCSGWSSPLSTSSSYRYILDHENLNSTKSFPHQCLCWTCIRHHNIIESTRPDNLMHPAIIPNMARQWNPMVAPATLCRTKHTTVAAPATICRTKHTTPSTSDTHLWSRQHLHHPSHQSILSNPTSNPTSSRHWSKGHPVRRCSNTPIELLVKNQDKA